MKGVLGPGQVVILTGANPRRGAPTAEAVPMLPGG